MKQRRDAKIFQKYDIDQIQVRIMNGDGAIWIDKLATKDTIRQKDSFHIHQEIIRDIPEEEYRRQLERLIAEKRYDEVDVYLEYLKYECGGEEKQVKKIEKLRSYLSNGLKRYQDVLEEQNRKMPEAPEDIEYRNLGAMESQIFTVLSKRFKSGRTAFSKLGATCLAKICASKVENKGVIELEKLEKAIEIDEELEKYMFEIEKNIKNIFGTNKKQGVSNFCETVELSTKNPLKETVKMKSKSDLKYINKFF